MFGKRLPNNVATAPPSKPKTAPAPGASARGGDQPVPHPPAPQTVKPGAASHLSNKRLSSEKVDQFNKLKMRLHRKLIDQLDLTRLVGEEEDLREQVKGILSRLADEENTLLNFNERQRLINEVLDETFGLLCKYLMTGCAAIKTVMTLDGTRSASSVSLAWRNWA